MCVGERRRHVLFDLGKVVVDGKVSVGATKHAQPTAVEYPLEAQKRIRKWMEPSLLAKGSPTDRCLFNRSCSRCRPYY